MYKIVFTNRMKKDVKRMKKRGKDIKKLIRVLDLLAKGEVLSLKYRDHQLSNNLADFRECHVEPDWLLLYRYYDDTLVLVATATGTHSDIFGI